MACASGVVSVDYLKKRTLIVIRDDSFRDIILKVSGHDPSQTHMTIECSPNGSDWTAVEGDTIRVAALGVMDAFGYKFLRIECTVPEKVPLSTDTPCCSTAVNAFNVLMSTSRKRRLPEKKVCRCVLF